METKATPAEDVILVKNVQDQGCSESLKTLIDRHTPLCYSIMQRYSHLFERNGVHRDDVIDDKEFLIYKSALSFRSDKKTKFSTWLGNQMRYLCLNAINKNRLLATEDAQLNKEVNKNAEDRAMTTPMEEIDYVKNLLAQAKDGRVQKIFQIRYFSRSDKKTPWSKVATEVGVSTQTAINLHNKTIKMLRKKANSKSCLIMDKI